MRKMKRKEIPLNLKSNPSLARLFPNSVACTFAVLIVLRSAMNFPWFTLNSLVSHSSTSQSSICREYLTLCTQVTGRFPHAKFDLNSWTLFTKGPCDIKEFWVYNVPYINSTNQERKTKNQNSRYLKFSSVAARQFQRSLVGHSKNLNNEWSRQVTVLAMNPKPVHKGVFHHLTT
jgi:hypothetical protein